jgi:hypothetical protein
MVLELEYDWGHTSMFHVREIDNIRVEEGDLYRLMLFDRFLVVKSDGRLFVGGLGLV